MLVTIMVLMIRGDVPKIGEVSNYRNPRKWNEMRHERSKSPGQQLSRVVPRYPGVVTRNPSTRPCNCEVAIESQASPYFLSVCLFKLGLSFLSASSHQYQPLSTVTNPNTTQHLECGSCLGYVIEQIFHVVRAFCKTKEGRKLSATSLSARP